ncbi:sensor histidine kinase [Anaerobium acetethylicum]|uniref:sensor histidine kinase n=1 Tax=Anaerobium acetethylicum TaxID=1619234 RepID=UPI0014720067|nr:histidine kinase [Anaerobium acetethylicum]
MKKEISLRNLLRKYWIGMFLFLVVVYFLLQSYMLLALTERTEESVQKSIFIAENGIEDSLQIVDSFIYESLYSGTTQSTSQLYNSLKNETDPVMLSVARNAVLTSLMSIVSWSDMIDFAMIYTDSTDETTWLEAGSTSNYATRREVKQLIGERIEQGEFNRLERYMICKSGQGNIMIRLLKIEDSYFVVGVSESEILRTLQSAEYDENSIAFAAEKDGTVIFTSEKVDVDFSPEQEGTYIAVDGKEYLQTGYVSDKTGYYFGMLTAKNSIISDMWFFRMLFFIMFLVLMILVPAIFYIIHAYVEKPIGKIANTMNQIAEGELDVTVEEAYQITELVQLVHAFNHMIKRIKQLKIEKYEVKLEAQKATMQYLQLQIKPHFYANVLNIIYSLAERKDYSTIQKISKSIVNYSRYMFHDATELVELQREIEHVHYYMEIQEIRYMMQITCQVVVPDETKSALIPPFIIQSFVENSVKYTFSTKKSSKITIHVETDEEKEYLTIRISDNGAGYSEELLQQSWEQKNEDGHIGLTNVYRRLKLIYDDKADIQLMNDHGAVAILKVPYISVDNMEFDDDDI